MINLSIKVSGLSAITDKFRESPRKIAQAISISIKESAFILERESKTALTVGYTRAIKTGLLRSQNVVREMSDFRASVYPLVNYAVYVHEGTYKMKPRPWFQVAAKTAGPQIQTVFDTNIAEALQ